MTTYNTTPLVRKERIGNFLWTIYTRSLPYQQQMLKDKLLQISGGNEDKLWQSFLRYQTAPEKENAFNSDITGVMVQVFCDEDIKAKHDKTDVEKLRLKAERINIQEQQAKLF